jgi:hypothetical protein
MSNDRVWADSRQWHPYSPVDSRMMKARPCNSADKCIIRKDALNLRYGMFDTRRGFQAVANDKVSRIMFRVLGGSTATG